MFEGADGRVARIEVSTLRDGTVDRWEFYEDDALARVEQDTTADGVPDRWETFTDGRVATMAFDDNGDDRPDRRLSYDPEGRLSTIESDPDETGAYTSTVEVPVPPGEG